MKEMHLKCRENVEVIELVERREVEMCTYNYIRIFVNRCRRRFYYNKYFKDTVFFF